jgi:hypothetical protein
MRKILYLTFILLCMPNLMCNKSYGADDGPCSSILFEEKFDDTDFSFRGWYDNTNLKLSYTEHIPGSKGSAEFQYNQGSKTPSSGSAIRKKFRETESLDVKYYVKYRSNWVGSEKNYHPHEFMLVTNKDNDWVGPAYTHLTIYIEQNGGVPLIAIQDGRNIDKNRVGKDLTEITEERSIAGCNGDSDGYGNGICYRVGSTFWNGKQWKAERIYFSNQKGPFYKNDWHLIEVYVKLNRILNGKALKNGIIRYWYDGKLIINYSDVILRTGQHQDMRFNQFIIGPWIGNGSPITQTFWIDDLVVACSKNN